MLLKYILPFLRQKIKLDLILLLQVMFTINFLEASHYKIASVMAKLECQQKLQHKFAKYIETTRDKQVDMVHFYHMFLRLWSEISLFHESIYDIAPGSFLIG